MGETILDVDVDLEALKALFWTDFGRGANMDFDHAACAAVADDLDYFANVERHKNHGDFSRNLIKKTRRCCRRAGRLAAVFADDADLDTIDGDCFERAVTQISAKVRAAARRLERQRDKVEIRGGVCY